MRLSFQFMVILCAALFLCVIGTKEAMANNCPSCDIPNSGRICYATDDKVVYYCNSTTWVSTAGRLTSTVPALWCNGASNFAIGFPVGFKNIGHPVIGVKAIERSYYGACIIKSDDTVACTPTNATSGYTTPPTVGTVKAIAHSQNNVCAIKTDNTLKCWAPATGVDLSGQYAVPGGLGTVKAVAEGGWFICALKTNDTVQCWGDNSHGQTTVPGGLGTVKAIYQGGGTSVCAIKTNDDVQCWGNNTYGQATAPAGLKAKRIFSSYNHYCAIKLDDTVQCWGNNSGGQTNVPVGLTNVKDIIIDQNGGIAIKTDNTLVAWPTSGNPANQTNADLYYGHIIPYTLLSSKEGMICYVK